jgi:hypothetical protein
MYLIFNFFISCYAWADVVNLNQVTFETALYHFDVSDSTMDPEGNTYLVGTIHSDWGDSYAPVVSGGIGTPAQGKIGVAKLDVNGRLVFTYYTDSNAFTVSSIGGNGTRPPRVTVDREGNIIVAMSTGAAGVPTVNAAYPEIAGIPEDRNRDIFLFKITPSGTLVFSTYFGSSSEEYLEGNDGKSILTVDSKGNIYIGGRSYYDNDQDRDFPIINPCGIIILIIC